MNSVETFLKKIGGPNFEEKIKRTCFRIGDLCEYQLSPKL